MRMETLFFPEEVIQHIQSFMSRKEAARSTILSKSWHTAWLTRPTVDLDNHDFFDLDDHDWHNGVFEELAKKTMQRYQDSSLNIESFRLCLRSGYYRNHFCQNLIASAIKLELSISKIDYRWSSFLPFRLPQEVLGSKTLLRLSVFGCEIYGKNVSCSRLKSLSLARVDMTNRDEFRNIIISCCNSLEELSLSSVYLLTVSRVVNLNELPKLRHLYLEWMDVDSMFFTDLASRFPCLKDLTIDNCYSWKKIHIATTSLQTISFKPSSYKSYVAKFDVPNIRKFTYSGEGVPSHLSINGASREWELHLTITSNGSHRICQLLDLKKLLREFRLSRISLSIDHDHCKRLDPDEYEVGTDVVEAEPTVVENLTIDAHSSDCCALLLGLLAICRPKFITHDCTKNESLAVLCKGLMHRPITPNCGIPNQKMFGRFGLKKVNMDVYQEFDTEWRGKHVDVLETPKKKRKIRFELIWEYSDARLSYVLLNHTSGWLRSKPLIIMFL